MAVHAQITGELTSVHFNEGEDVREGQVLFTLDRRPLEAALQQAEANLARDTAQAANARAQAHRYRGPGRTRHRDARAGRSERAPPPPRSTPRSPPTAPRSRTPRSSCSTPTIIAPLSGRTGALMVHAGNLVRANDTTPLVVINQVSPIYVSFAIPEAQLRRPQALHGAGHAAGRGEAARRDGRGRGRDHLRRQRGRSDDRHDQSQGGRSRTTNHRLWPGQFVNVVVTLATEPHAVVVPTAAVQTGQQGSYVFVVKPDQTVDLRAGHDRRAPPAPRP